jgi:beta-lactamase class C
MFRFLCFSVIFAFSFDVFASKIDSSISELRQQIEKLVKTKKIPGCAVAIVDHDKIVFMKAFGVKKLGKGKSEPINLETVFQLGSISKPMTATLVAILQKQGRLNVDLTIKPYLPWIHENTKVRHLLSHSTGYDRGGWNNKIEINTPRITLLNDLSAHSQKTPGESFDYHNLAFSLIEDVLSRINGVPFERLMLDHLFGPLDMKFASCGYLPFERNTNKAWPHVATKKGAIQACSQLSQYYHHLVPSAGGVNANIRDMANFLFLQLNGMANMAAYDDLASLHRPILPTKDTVAWLKKEVGKDEIKTWYGLGFRILDVGKKRIVYHGGWLTGFKNFLAFRPDRKLGIVILHNSEYGFAKKTAVRFLMNAD